MGIDAVGRTGDKGAEVLPFCDLEDLHLVGIDDDDLVDLIGQGLVEDAHEEDVAQLDLIEVGEELGAGQAAMARQNAMAGRAADGKRRALDMADGDLQYGGVDAVVDRQRHLDVGDLDIAHDAAARDIQQAFVFGALVVAHHIAVVFVGQGSIVVEGVLPDVGIVDLVDLGDHLCIVGDHLRLMQGVPIVGEAGIQQQGQPCKKDDEQKNGRDIFLEKVHILTGFSLPLHPGEKNLSRMCSA